MIVFEVVFAVKERNIMVLSYQRNQSRFGIIADKIKGCISLYYLHEKKGLGLGLGLESPVPYRKLVILRTKRSAYMWVVLC